MDWEAKIIDICEDLGVETEHYNEDELTREIVAKRLGFPSFESFNAFPESSAIVDGRGSPLRPEHYGFQSLLAESCCNEIRHQYNISVDDLELETQVTRLFHYVMENFQLEQGLVALLQTAKSLEDLIDISSLPCYQLVADKYQGLNEKIIENE